MKTYTVVLQGPQESTQVEGPLEAIELDVFEDVEGSARARSVFGGRHVTLKDVVEGLGQREPHPMELKQEDVNEALRLLKAGPGEDLVSAAKRCHDAMGDALTVQAISAHLGRTIRFDYTNHRGACARRRVRPELIFFGQTVHHPEKQWFLRGFDVDKNEWRDFAIRDISDGRLTPTE